MPPLLDAIIPVLAPLAPLLSRRVWPMPSSCSWPVLLALFALVTLLALQMSQHGQIAVPVTAWYHKAEPAFSDCLALVRRHLWRPRHLVHSTPGAESKSFPQEVLDLLIHGLHS